MVMAGLGLLSTYLWLGYLATAVLALRLHEALRRSNGRPVALATVSPFHRRSDRSR